MPVVGLLSSTRPEGHERRVAAFRQGLAETGYIEGRNVAMEVRWADGQYDRLPRLVADLVHRQVAVIVIYGAVNAVLAAKAATTTIPIVFLIGSDPVAFRLVESLNRPGGNTTGVTLLIRELARKRLELLRELVPHAATIGLLVNPSNSNTEDEVRDIQDAGRSLGLQISIFKVISDGDIDTAFAGFAQQGVGAFMVATDASFTSRFGQIAALASRHAVPGIVNSRDYVDAGGLMSYGANQLDAFRLVGNYAGRILKGEKPANLPVQQPTKFEMVFNLKTARALGFQVPTSILLRADEVIE